MELNYWWIGIVGVLAVLLIFWLVKRDRKDEKNFEKSVIGSEIKPEDPDPNKDRMV